MSSLGACLIVRDGAPVLPACLTSLKGAIDVIVVVDTGSVDDSVAIARRLGARVVEWAWRDDFAAARNVALEHCPTEWVLSIDADEVAAIGNGLHERLAKTPEEIDAYAVEIELEADRDSGGILWHREAKLFRPRRVRWQGRVHEHLVRANGASLRVEPIELRVASDYAPLLDPPQTGQLPTKVRSLRKLIATEVGFVVPTVAIRTDVLLEAGQYRILINGVQVAAGRTEPNAMLAIGNGIDALTGERTTDPVFGLPAVVIPAASKARAIVAGSTVLDRTSLLVTHLGEAIRSHTPELLSLQQVRQLMDVVRQTDPAVTEEVNNAQVSAGELLRVCRGLLAERVPIRNLVRILEAVAERARVSKDAEALLEAARASIGATICSDWSSDGKLSVAVLSPPTEAHLAASLTTGENGASLGASPEVLSHVVDQARDLTRSVEDDGRRLVLVCSARLRPALKRLLTARVPTLGVLSVAELSRDRVVDHVGTIAATEDETAAATVSAGAS